MDTAATTREQPAIWASVREAIHGSGQDYTTGSLNRPIFLLAIPMVLEMAMESLFAVVDVFWVAGLFTKSLNRHWRNRVLTGRIASFSNSLSGSWGGRFERIPNLEVRTPCDI